MKTDPAAIFETISAILSDATPPLKVTKSAAGVLEVSGIKETMQGRQKVAGMYFGTAMQKPKDCRLYFFPIYLQPDEYSDLPENLRKCLKGKSCFHIKKLDDTLEKAVREMVAKGVKQFERDQYV